MEKNYWQRRWESHNIGFNQKKTNSLLVEHLKILNLAVQARIFVPLCGKSIDMLYLLNQGYSVIGVELSEIACAEFFTENNIAYKVEQQEHFSRYYADAIELYCGDFFAMPRAVLQTCQAVYDRAALIALPPSIRQAYVDFFNENLAPQTKMLLNTIDYDQKQMTGPPFAINSSLIKQYYGKKAYIELLQHEVMQKIAPHLAAKGLQQAFNDLYLLTF